MTATPLPAITDGATVTVIMEVENEPDWVFISSVTGQRSYAPIDCLDIIFEKHVDDTGARLLAIEGQLSIIVDTQNKLRNQLITLAGEAEEQINKLFALLGQTQKSEPELLIEAYSRDFSSGIENTKLRFIEQSIIHVEYRVRKAFTTDSGRLYRPPLPSIFDVEENFDLEWLTLDDPANPHFYNNAQLAGHIHIAFLTPSGRILRVPPLGYKVVVNRQITQDYIVFDPITGFATYETPRPRNCYSCS